MPLVDWVSHRTLTLPDNDVAIIADQSSGWCIVTADEYATLGQCLPVDLPVGAPVAVLDGLWSAGLITRDGRPHPSTIYRAAGQPSAVLLKVTGTCNIQCEYCYDYDSRRFRTQMSLEQVQSTLSQILATQDHVSIVFHGGEPLLRFSLIKQIVAWLEPYSDRVDYAIQTNGTRFTSEIVTFLEQHDFGVGISLDGMNDASNMLRSTRNGETAFSAVSQFMARYPSFVSDRCDFLAVASRTSAPVLSQFALWLQERGAKGLSITFLDLSGRGANLSDMRLTPDEAVAVYRELMDLVRSGEIASLALRSLISRINNLFTFHSRDLCNHGPCGAAGDFLVLDSEGKRRSCDCIYHPYFELGESDADETKARHAVIDRHHWLRQNGPQCSTCPIFGFCGGTCVAKAIARSGTPNSVDPVECALARMIYPELLREYQGTHRPMMDYYLAHASNKSALQNNLRSWSA